MEFKLDLKPENILEIKYKVGEKKIAEIKLSNGQITDITTHVLNGKEFELLKTKEMISKIPEIFKEKASFECDNIESTMKYMPNDDKDYDCGISEEEYLKEH